MQILTLCCATVWGIASSFFAISTCLRHGINVHAWLTGLLR